ncbi:MAG: hypothetical protein P8124_04605 [Gammaproteobacteria bacterium]
MTRQGHTLFGLFVAGVTAAAIWASVAIPVHTQRQARDQVGGLIARVKGSAGADGCPSSAGERLDSPYLARVAVHPGRCAVTLQLGDRAPVARSVRGASITLVRDRSHAARPAAGSSGLWHCVASGGHGAGQGDFPADCRYQVQTPLL